MSARVALAFGVVVVAALSGGAGAAPTAAQPTATAQAWAIRVIVPGGIGGGTAAVTAPPSAAPVTTASFGYPDEGSVVAATSTRAAASVTEGANASAAATSGLTGLVVFGGEITADAVSVQASATAGAAGADGNVSGTAIANLQVLGATPTGDRVALADWGSLAIDTREVDGSAPQGARGYRGAVTALDIRLTAEHGGLPAGSEIQIGFAETTAQTPATGTATTTAAPVETKPLPLPQAPEPVKPRPVKPRPVKPEPLPSGAGAPETPEVPAAPMGRVGPEPPAFRLPIPESLLPPLEGGPYVFPVFGPASYIDTYGDVRADVSYHHGADIFGELGQPLLAVADGTVFSVGWNKIGGNRLWLRDRRGNAYYYAHLAAFSTLIFDGARVKAGQVVGFMGNTGDAKTTAPHLHFEVHPVSLLFLEYDGAVDPTPYMDEWRHLGRLPFPVPTGWAPRVPGSSAAPQPGAILLAVSDISTADGLDPGSLRRAIEAPQARP